MIYTAASSDLDPTSYEPRWTDARKPFYSQHDSTGGEINLHSQGVLPCRCSTQSELNVVSTALSPSVTMRSLGILPREDNEPPSQTHHPEPHHTSSSSLEQSSKSTPRPHQHHEHEAQQHEHKALKIIPAIAMAITLILLLIILGCYCVLRKRRLRRGAQEDTASAASFDLGTYLVDQTIGSV